MLDMSCLQVVLLTMQTCAGQTEGGEGETRNTHIQKCWPVKFAGMIIWAQHAHCKQTSQLQETCLSVECVPK